MTLSATDGDTALDFADTKTVFIDDQNILNYKEIEDGVFKTEGRTLAGHIKRYENARLLPLHPEVEVALTEIRKMNLSDEYVFSKGEFRYHTHILAK